ncbi:MAG: C1 family peptidase [Chloroflexales bacterium]|nr:C1 family peptidase [Chloroflexales bacterium]
MRELIPLEKVDAIDAALRKKLEAFWITSVEEFVSTTRSSNQQYGSGRAALAVALGMSEEALKPIISAASALLPADTSFSVPVEQELGDGLFLGEYSDLDAASFAVPLSLPEQVEPLFALPKPQNQGVRNSCVAFTLAAAYQILSKDATDLSEQFLYWACKDKDGIPGDVGTDPIKAVQVLQTVGVCSEAAWPYKPAPSDSKNPGHGPPPPTALDEAKRRRIKAFQKLPATSVMAIKSALAAGKPVLIGLRIWEHWNGSWQGSTLGHVRAPLPGERQKGGHAMCVLGYRDDEKTPGRGYFIVRNSWGPDWGKENPDGPGYCHVPYKLVAEQGLAAIALEGVATGPAPAPASGGGAQAEPGQKAGSGLGGAAEERVVDLEKVYAEVAAIRDRLDSLLAGEVKSLRDRLDSLAAALAEAASASSAPAPAPVAPSTLAEADRARKPVAAAKVFDGAPAVILSRLSGAVDPKNQELYPNGVSPEGTPLLRIDALSASKLAQGKGGGEPKERIDLYKAKHTASSVGHLGTVADIAQEKLEEARWAVVINALEDAALIKASWPLIAHRMRQMGLTPPPVDFRDGENAGAWLSRHSDGLKQTLKESWGKIPPVLLYRPGERVNQWLARHGVSNGPVDPRRGVPFYLLLLGRPGPLSDDDETSIPLGFQYELDIFWGVGRVCFTDALGQHRLGDYTTYAERLVGLEQRAAAEAQRRLRKEIAYFATRHEGDTSTQRSADELVGPLAAWASNPENIPLKKGFGHTLHSEGAATRATLERILRGGDDGKAPALLFTASHGLGGLPLGDERLIMHTGSLVLQDWAGSGPISREQCFTGADLAALGPTVEGSLAFLFACYSLGCPAIDEFLIHERDELTTIAPFPLIAQLPQLLLLSGALGVIGHVDRAWTYALSNGKAIAQSQPFEDVLGRLLQGRRLGDALDQFDVMRGARAVDLVEELENIKFGKTVEPFELAQLWMARNDARNYALLGDPAARLPYHEG